MTLPNGLYVLLIMVASPHLTGMGAAAPSSGPDVQIETVDGRLLVARLQSIDENGEVHYVSDEGSGRLALSDLIRLSPANVPGATGEPRPSANCTLYLLNGSVLRARILSANGDARVIRVDVGLADALDVPLSALRGIRLSAATHEAAEKELTARMQAGEQGRDFLIAVREGRPVVVPGALERLTPDAWSFRVGDKLQSAPLDRAYAFILGSLGEARPLAPATVRIDPARSVVGRIVSADTKDLVLDAEPLDRMRIPWTSLQHVALRSDRIVHLSELAPTRVEHRSIFDASWPPQRDRNVTGGPMRLAGRSYDRGMGVHAYTALTYELRGEFEKFTAIVGIDDAVAPHGRAVFRVECDGRVVYESPPISPGQVESIQIDLSGVKVLTLICDPGDDLDFSDHCNWASARLIRSRADSIR